MTESHVLCPQCEGRFHWGDGFPDLYGKRLCSLQCREEWLAKYHYGSVPDKVATQQLGDGNTPISRQISDIPLAKQRADIDGPSQFKGVKKNQQMG